ncbi:hypothetical protein FT643_19045 [Ketobacter sp. MCCC 1A13808]|uniref:hypothetical protein n=1 Tax=Ketobacter sp. MCCC 1A13808 TaxID=2602738 RepID=UPI0012EC00F5|nr:hypothetical protein [Ketobacter sp. MCCC 1A13808]MVF14237.1 hypothetical protein [Ketobacter sp. MCCC 1A13808]
MDLQENFYLGKCWAAISNNEVIGIISMRVPNSVDFEAFRTRAIACLELLGEIRTGELVERGGERYFVQRSNHARRGKIPKPEKEFLIFHPSHAQNDSDIPG